MSGEVDRLGLWYGFTHTLAPIIGGTNEDDDERNMTVSGGIHVLKVQAASPVEQGRERTSDAE